MSLTFDDLFVNPIGGDLAFTSTLTAELGDIDVQEFMFFIETLEFSPTVNMTLDNLTESTISTLTYTMSQDAGESEILSSSVTSDGGSFNLSGLIVGDVIGSGTLFLALFAGDYDIESDLVVSNINNENYTVFNQVTASNNPVYPVGSTAGGFVISNTESGISIYTEIPVDGDYIAEAYSMSLTFDDLFVNPIGGDLAFTSTLTAELGDIDVQEFMFFIEALEFSPTVNMTLDNLTGSEAANLTYSMSQDNGESEILSSSVTSDGGSFNLSGLVVGDVIGSGTLFLALFAGDYDIESDLVVSNVNNENYTVFNQVTASNNPVYPVGSTAGGFVISNTESGISIYTEIPVDGDYIAEAYSMSLTFDGLFVNPIGGDLAFTSTLTSELGDVDVQGFVFNILDVNGCTDPLACNYSPGAVNDDGSCYSADECGVCDGSGIAEGDCDCDGNVLDAVNVCGGNCIGDADNDGICDSIDPCIDLDGTGCVFPGCTDITNPGYDPVANFDDGSCLLGGCTISVACNYNEDADYQLTGTCDFSTCAGCIDDSACNYDDTATLPNNNSCTYPEVYLDCSGNCLCDIDGDGVCCENEIIGCIIEGNPAYNPSATDSDPDACLVAGCLIPFACNYDEDADYIVISLCEFNSCIGCLDNNACNYDASASISSAAICFYPASPFLDCDGNCNNDSDGDEVCDEQEIPGCMDEAAVNFNSFATDDNDSCIILIGGCVIPFACNYDPLADFYDGSCDFSCLGIEGTAGMSEAGCTNSYACNYGAEGEPCQFFNAAGDICMIGGCNHTSACNYSNAAEYNDGSCDFASCVSLGCTLSNACNFNDSATLNDGSCDYTSCYGCTNIISVNFDSNATHNDGSCIIHGCTVSVACNYDVTATSENGSCEYASCMNMGCTDLSACNYNSSAIVNDGTCVNAVYGFDCNGDCTTDLNNNNVCDTDDVYGCTDTSALNFNNDATVNNGTCSYDTYGCTNDMACNFNQQASSDNGSCEFTTCYGCMNNTACNFSVDATHPSECTYVSLYEINGSTQTTIGQNVVYTYPTTEGSQYIWSILGGEIISGLGTEEVIVVWSDMSGTLTVSEITNTGCEGVDVVLTLGSISSVVDQTVQFSVYPNPANDNIVVVSDLGISVVTIFDATGRDVYMKQQLNRTNTIDVSNLANGTYRIVAESKEGRRSQTMVINH